MEPMTLGSPTHSPPGSPNTSYLPPFLMGEFNQPSTPRTGSLSPTKRSPFAFATSPPVRAPTQPAPQFSTPIHSKPSNNVSFSNKANGPPTQGLFDTLHPSDKNNKSIQNVPAQYTSPHRDYLFNQDGIIGSANNSIMGSEYPQNRQNFDSFQQTDSRINNDSFFYNGNYDTSIDDQISGESNECWVTVFGFPSSAANMILTQFSNCGNIVEKKYPSQGNWVWLKFTSRIEAGRALALNGRVFSGGLMVGVVPCSKSPNNYNNQVNRGGARQLAVGSSRLQNTSALSPGTPTNVGAQRSSGAISRALEYVFGW